MSNAAEVLFDAPGPKARQRHRLVAVAAVVAVAAILYWIIRALANPANNQFTAQKWVPFVEGETWTAYLLPGLLATLQAAVISVVLAVVAGILLGMGRLSAIAPLRWACGLFVEFFRAVPVLMMMLFAYYFGLVIGVRGEGLTLFGVVCGLTFYNSCVIAELIRSGVTSLPRGQSEAGLAVGLTDVQTLRLVLLPQAITAMLPSLVSQLVVIVKDSALGFWITYAELIRSGQNLASLRGNLIPTFLVLAAIYIVVNYGLTRLARFLEVKLLVRRGKTPPTDAGLEPAMAPNAAGVAR